MTGKWRMLQEAAFVHCDYGASSLVLMFHLYKRTEQVMKGNSPGWGQQKEAQIWEEGVWDGMCVGPDEGAEEDEWDSKQTSITAQTSPSLLPGLILLLTHLYLSEEQPGWPGTSGGPLETLAAFSIPSSLCILYFRSHSFCLSFLQHLFSKEGLIKKNLLSSGQRAVYKCNLERQQRKAMPLVGVRNEICGKK
ncbi:hypothetical protein MJT46_005074 [Ovis ammon polii x Ovis aries]|nr:hypothetical protein MJT46_005074 [Ovis ammon polii x Ovis aries]